QSASLALVKGTHKINRLTTIRLWPTLPEIRTISSTITSSTFQMLQVLVEELVIGTSAMSKMIPSHYGGNNRLFDNTALYFFIVSVMYFISQRSVHLVSSASHSKSPF